VKYLELKTTKKIFQKIMSEMVEEENPTLTTGIWQNAGWKNGRCTMIKRILDSFEFIFRHHYNLTSLWFLAEIKT
jgi:hypothetical protein